MPLISLATRAFTSRKSMPTTRRIVEPSPVKLLVVAVLALSSAAQAQSADPRRVLADIPGLDFTRLAPPAQKELAAVFTDEFDYCGKPLTVAAALKKPDACKHTRRLAVYRSPNSRTPDSRSCGACRSR